jgi:hypothetical protein
MRHFAFCLAVVLAAGTTAGMAQDIGGNYIVQGKGGDGSSYSGTAEITPTSNTTCRIVWTTGGQTSEGICMRYENAFAAGYTLGNEVGLAIYEVLADGTLQGTWTLAGQGGAGVEVLTPAR